MPLPWVGNFNAFYQPQAVHIKPEWAFPITAVKPVVVLDFIPCAARVLPVLIPSCGVIVAV